MIYKNKIKNVLIDLDGTLLPMDFDVFLKGYMQSVSNTAGDVCLTKEAFTKGLWAGIVKMMQNDGSSTNEDAFWAAFSFVTGVSKQIADPILNEYYNSKFGEVKEYCGFDKNAKILVEKLKNCGYSLILATNPVFPKIGTFNRLKWAGVDFDSFTYVSTYENSSYCKPNLKYYEEILAKFNLNASECLMIGNDVLDDMVALNLGMQTFLLTDCLINKNNEDLSKYEKGSFEDLFKALDI
ncbi:MAG: HAD family hydrolase [Clostridia bacterium]|nr:HAD family hydrolase [Clostridia bacterium]